MIRFPNNGDNIFLDLQQTCLGKIKFLPKKSKRHAKNKDDMGICVLL